MDFSVPRCPGRKEKGSSFPLLLLNPSWPACPGAGSAGIREAETRMGKSWRVVYLSDAITVRGMRPDKVGVRQGAET